MPCQRCTSPNQRDYRAEVTIHLPGTKDLEKEPKLVFPSVRVCLDCGFAEFQLDKADVQQLISEAGAAPAIRGKEKL